MSVGVTTDQKQTNHTEPIRNEDYSKMKLIV